MVTLRWVLAALVPAVVLAYLVRRTKQPREPVVAVAGTFVLGGLGAALALYLEARAAALTGVDIRVDRAGPGVALVFLFGFVAPLREAMKVTAAWPAFRSRAFDEPLDGLVYSSAAALGFAAVENAVLLRASPGAVAIARALLALPAHLFFAALWGYALGRAKRDHTPGRVFPYAWLAATACHGLYIHLVWGRGPGALLGVVPLLCVMGAVLVVARRDLQALGERPSRAGLSNRLSPLSLRYLAQPPSMRTMRDALRRRGRPIALTWVVFGSFVTVGAMIAGLAAAVAVGHATGVDFASVDERDVATVGPVALLGAGLLAAFPFSGYLIARASGLPTLLEPAFAALSGIFAMFVVLGLAAPVSVVFAVALAPFAFGLACVGAWVGKPEA